MSCNIFHNFLNCL